MNPLWIAKLIPAAIGLAIGFVLAWGIQSLRLTHAEQEFTAFRQEQTRIYQEAQTNADIQRKQASEKYASARAELDAAVESGEVMRRCIAAGKCGVRTVRVCNGPPSNTANLSLQARTGVDATGANAIPAGTGATAEDPVVADCAITTLMINQLQAEIEAQKGYAQ